MAKRKNFFGRFNMVKIMTTEQLIELINSTQDGEIWLYDSKLKDHLAVVEEALEKDLIHFIRADVGNITTEFIRVSVWHGRKTKVHYTYDN